MNARDSVFEIFTACGRPVIFTGITNFMGFIILSLSSFQPLVSLGWLTAVTMITALSGDLVLQPALLVIFDRRGYTFHHRLTPDPDAES
jgi:predicted RND superfamily exporter protein